MRSISFLKKISGAAPAQPEASQASPGSSSPAAPASLPDDKDAACFFHVFLEEGVGMENLRAYMIVNAVRECEVTFRFYPSDMETDPDTSQKIAENGFFLAFDSSEDASKAEGILKTQNHIRSYELVNVPKAAPPAKAEEKKGICFQIHGTSTCIHRYSCRESSSYAFPCPGQAESDQCQPDEAGQPDGYCW